MSERLETINQTCERVQVSRRTLYRMLPDMERAGVAVRVPPVTGRVRVSPSGLDAWLAMVAARPRPVARLRVQPLGRPSGKATPKNQSRRAARMPRGLHLSVDSRGYFVWRAVDPTTGRRIKRSTGLRDIKLAAARAKTFEDWLERRKAGLRDYSCWRIELAPLVEAWSEDLGCSPARRKVAAAALRRALAEIKLRTAAELDDVGALDRRLKALAAKGYKPSVLRRGFQDVLRRFSRWLAENQRYLDRDPLALWKPIVSPAKGEVRPRRREIEPEDFARALLALEHQGRGHLRLTFHVLLISGARVGALFDRDVGHLDRIGCRLDFGQGTETKRRGAGALDSDTTNALAVAIGGRQAGPLFLSAQGARLTRPRFLQAWRAALSLALVDRFWPPDEPRDLELALLVSDALVGGRPRVSRGGNPVLVAEGTIVVREALAARVATLAAKLRDTWTERMTGRDVHTLRKTHRTWARSRSVLGEAIDAQLGHAAHEDAHTSAVLRAAAGSRTGRKHYTDEASALFDPGASARAVRAVLDDAFSMLERGTTMLLAVDRSAAPDRGCATTHDLD